MLHSIPPCVLDTIYTVSQPVILNHPVATNTSVYSSVQFSCTARGFRLIDIVWMKETSSMLPRTSVITTSTSPDKNEITSTLQISEVIGYYSGQYYCVARNSAGNVSSNSANLYVEGNYTVCLFYHLQ